MSKVHIIDGLVNAAPITKPQAEAALKAISALISESLSEEGSFRWHGIGSWVVVERPEKDYINPRTRETVRAPKKRIVRFKPAKQLLESINND